LSLDVSPLKLFGTSGIRGLINRNLTPAFAAQMSIGFAHMLGGSGDLAVGMDVRLHAPAIRAAVVAGLTAGGLNVHDCSVAPTPAVLHYVKDNGLAGAVVVTGSHTIPPVIGLLYFRGDGELSPSDEERLEEIYFNNRATSRPWNKVGRIESVDPSDSYFKGVLRGIPRRKLSGFKVVVDPGNGASSGLLRRLIEALGCRVWAINDSPDGRFPSRSPYPRPEVLGPLCRAVKERSADLGVATDGDGDRAIFVTEKGKVLYGDVTGSLFARELLSHHKGSSIVAPINSSNLIADVCRSRGRLITTRVGPPAIIDALRKNKNAIFGFEETGKYIWPSTLLYGDCALSTIRMLALLDSQGTSMSELQHQLPRYKMIKRAFRCSEQMKLPLLLRVYELVKAEGETITIDGVKVVYPDRSWILFRPSGTEPFFRCYVEAKNTNDLTRLARYAFTILRSASSSLLHPQST